MSVYTIVRCGNSSCNSIQVTVKKKGLKCKTCGKMTNNPIKYGYTENDPNAASDFCKWIKEQFARGMSANDIFGEIRNRRIERLGLGS